MSAPRATGIYSALLRLYPRRFRDEYGIDMALLFAQQLHDQSTGRVVARCVIDLAITIPTQHLEAHMNHVHRLTVPVAFGAVSISGLALAFIGGSNLAMLSLAVFVVAGAVSVASWRRYRAISPGRSTTGRWWQILLAGVTLLATTIVTVNITGEVSEVWWLPMMLALLIGIVTTAAGLILGAIHRFEGHPRTVART